MLKSDRFIYIAGESLVDSLDAEQRARVPQTAEGYFSSKELCALQVEQSRRGILGVEIVKSNYGYSVRYDSGLQNFGLLATSRMLGGTLEAAEEFARKWVAEDSVRRYAWRRK